jgi:quercetin dioxygenase-like cupin family protein
MEENDYAIYFQIHGEVSMKVTSKIHKRQPEIISGARLVRLDKAFAEREKLAARVEKLAVEAFNTYELSLQKLTELRPLIAQLRELFMKLKPGEQIAGCRTWTNYCERILHRTDRRIRQILHGVNPASEKHSRKALPAKKDMSAEAEPKTVMVPEAYIEAPKHLSEKQATMASAPTPKQIADPLKVDSKHYKVEFENDRVRVLRVKYGPREKSVMHGHPATLAIYLTENRARFTFPGGKTEERSWKAGQTMFIPAEEHLPENLTDKPLELVLVEMKS